MQPRACPKRVWGTIASGGCLEDKGNRERLRVFLGKSRLGGGSPEILLVFLNKI